MTFEYCRYNMSFCNTLRIVFVDKLLLCKMKKTLWGSVLQETIINRWKVTGAPLGVRPHHTNHVVVFSYNSTHCHVLYFPHLVLTEFLNTSSTPVVRQPAVLSQQSFSMPVALPVSEHGVHSYSGMGALGEAGMLSPSSSTLHRSSNTRLSGQFNTRENLTWHNFLPTSNVVNESKYRLCRGVFFVCLFFQFYVQRLRW